MPFTRLAPTFFDEGVNQFEHEIELLLERQSELEQPVLAVDPAVQFDPDQVEALDQPHRFNDQDSER
jgi:hypothetical protein